MEEMLWVAFDVKVTFKGDKFRWLRPVSQCLNQKDTISLAYEMSSAFYWVYLFSSELK